MVLPKARGGQVGQGGRGEIEASARPDRAGTGIWGLCLGASSRGVLPAASRWELHRHFTDEDAKAWRDAMRSREPPRRPALPRAEGGPAGAVPQTTPVRPVLPGGRPSGNGLLQSQAPPPLCSLLALSPPSALPIHLLSLPGRASGPYITPRSPRRPGQAVGRAPLRARDPHAQPGCHPPQR